MDVNALIDAAKRNAGLSTDKALTEALGVSHGAVHHWRNGNHIPSPEHGQAMAEMAGKDPGPIVAELLILRTTHPGLKRTLERLRRAALAALSSGLCILCKILGTFGRATEEGRSNHATTQAALS
jgi:hypothetical protein